MKTLCYNCVFYVESKNKAYCEYDVWTFTDIMKAKLYNPFMFDCIEYERGFRIDYQEHHS